MARRITYIHRLPGWPRFTWDSHALAGRLGAVRHAQGRLIARMEALGLSLREEAALTGLTEEVITSSGIEGEILDKAKVRSSIARRLGISVNYASYLLRGACDATLIHPDVESVRTCSRAQ